MGSVIGYPEAHGATATFETDVAENIKSLIVDVEPVQDLHGYDHPWPAGGGKNLLDQNDTKYLAKDARSYGASDDRALAQINTLPAGTYTLSFTEKIVSLNEMEPVGTRFGLYLRATSDGQTFNVNAQTDLITPTVGQIITKSVTFTLTDEYVGNFQYFYVYTGKNISGPIPNEYTANIYDVQLELGSTATAYTPYSNICPITGWTAASITHHGKNIAQYWQQGYIGTDGSIKTGLTYAIAKPVFVQNGRPIAVSNTAGDYQGIAVFSDSSLENMIYRLANTASTYTASQDCYVVCWFNKVYSEYTESEFVDRGVQIEFAYSATTFEPYSHDEYDITFPSEAGTVYGGTLDVVKGELVVDRAGIAVSSTTGTLRNNGRSSITTRAYFMPSIAKLPGLSGFISDRFAIVSRSDVVGKMVGRAAAGAVEFFLPITTPDTTTGVQNWFAENATQLVYELATPITYQLTPQEIQTIIGTNTIYADTGDVSVLYPKTLTPAETVSNVSLMELRRSIMMAMQHNYIPEITTYGVEWNYADPSTVLKRTGAASKFANPIPAESLNEFGWSPFDNVYPWSEMKRYNIINGEVAYSEDDAGYSETLYDTMVYIPEFYYYAYKDTANQKWYWSISANPLEGYTKHPGSGRYVGRFHTGGSSSGVFSKSGVTPLSTLTRSNFRTYSHNKGSKWWQIDLATWSAIQLLYLIEFANWNSQSVLGLGNNNMEYPENTGETNGLLYHSIKRSGSANAYRSIENPFSNILIFIDGIVAYNKRIYTTTNISNYGEKYYTMQNTNISLPEIGFIKNIGYSSICPFAFIPNESFDGDGSTYVSDMVESGNVNTNHIAAVGGHWNQLPKRGLFFIACASEASIAHPTLGSRLMFIPSN